MILGLGIDLIETDRIRRAYAQNGRRFLDRILSESEIEYCLGQADPAIPLAARFAAKEAIAKAFGTGIGASLGWHDMVVERLASGQPVVRLVGQGQVLLAERQAKVVHLSLTHTATHAAAVAVLES
ncbi:MAG TPA: holo-ACP synthase [Candidatus Limnocylindria bacterium]|jgi:holo-[acyl-carrier protein] synthase|nr:holo-ACP synthase [Candidatus Limnocylindria bacterium]